MNMRNKIGSLLLISAFLFSTGCGKHKKPEEAAADTEVKESALTDPSKEKAPGEKEAENKEKPGEEDPNKNKPAAPAGDVALGGASALYSGIAAKQSGMQISDIAPLIADKLKKNKEFESEYILMVVASLKEKGFQLESLMQNNKLPGTFLALANQAESKLELVSIADEAGKAIPAKLTIGDKTFELVDADQSKVLKPKDAKDIVITGNAVKLEVGEDKFESKLPFVTVESTQKDVLKKWVLDLSVNGYMTPLKIKTIGSSTEEGVKNECVMINSFDEAAGKKLKGLKSILITNFVDLQKKEINFSKLEKATLEKLPVDIEIPVHVICSSIVSDEEKNINSIVITQVPGSTLKVVNGAAKATAAK